MNYHKQLRKHYEHYFGQKGQLERWNQGPVHLLKPDFAILTIQPNKMHQMWAYLTIGMSDPQIETNPIELMVYAPRESDSVLELLTVAVYYHQSSAKLNLHHTINIGQPWIEQSLCEHGYISLPYLDGEKLELFAYGGKTVHCYWLIPITKAERDFKKEHGAEALERLFEEKSINYLDPKRSSLV